MLIPTVNCGLFGARLNELIHSCVNALLFYSLFNCQVDDSKFLTGETLAKLPVMTGCDRLQPVTTQTL
jgi:hypothetical protein